MTHASWFSHSPYSLLLSRARKRAPARRAVWLRTVEQFITRADVAQCIIVVSPDDQEMFRRRYGANLAFMNVQSAGGVPMAERIRAGR